MKVAAIQHVTLASRSVSENMGPRTNVIVWLLVMLSMVLLTLRVYCKTVKHRGLWWDDWVLIASWLCFLIDAILTSVNTSLGFGLHFNAVDPANYVPIVLQGTVGGTFSIVAAVWSKTSFAITLLRITEGRLKVFVWFIIISINVAMGLSALFEWIQCTPLERGWNMTIAGTCWDPRINVIYGIFSGAYSGLMDIILALLPWKIISALQMRRKEKIGVALAMSMGVFAGSTAFVKCSKIPTIANGDFTFEGYQLVVWGAAEVAVTIMAASIPVLRVLVREVKASTRQQYGPSKETMGNSRPMTTVVIASTGNFGQTAKGSQVSNAHSEDGSEKSIVGEKLRGGGIVQTQEIAIEYHERRTNGRRVDVGNMV